MNYRISFQLYGARKFPPVDAQLEALAAIGFDAVEPYGGAYEGDVAAFRKKLDAMGLLCPTAHIALDELDRDLGAVVGDAQTLGLETVITPYLAPDRRPTDVAGWKALGERLSRHAAALAEKGLTLAWHNHDFEYAALRDGSRPIDHILEASDVLFEPDIGWIAAAGGDIAVEITRFPGKIVAFHIKDRAPWGVTVDDGWTDIGAGSVDWKGLWPTIAGAGTNLLVFENDNPSDWRRFAERSYTYVAKLTGRG